jgi:5'-3' exonuclease
MQLIDGGMFAFAAYHALKKKMKYPLTFQVPRMLRKLVEDVQDTFIVFWNGENLWRRERLRGYRDRPEIWHEAGRLDFDSMVIALSALGAVQFRTEGREADDDLASVAHALEGKEPLLIRSDDKDFMQLLSRTTAMHGRVRGNVGYSDVEGILGVQPEYVADFLALSGDKADGIPSILTPAPARDFIARYGHVRDILEGDSSENAEARKQLGDRADQLAMNLELVDLSADAVGPPPPPLDEYWDSIDAAQTVGKHLEIEYLTADSLAGDFASFAEWGRRTMERVKKSDERRTKSEG